MKMLLNLKIFAILIFGLQAMSLQGAEESKMSKNNELQVQEIPTLRKLSAIQVLLTINDVINSNEPLDQSTFDGLLNTITLDPTLFSDVINNDIYAQDGKLVMKKGQLLIQAAENSNVQMTSLLIAAGADVNIKNEDGETPLCMAALYNSKEIANFIVDTANTNNIQIEDVNVNDYVTKQPYSARKNNEKEIELLISAGSDLKIQDNYGVTPLHHAVIYNTKDVIKILINKGANPNIPDKFGMTPLHIAVKNNYKEVAKLLIDAGADLKIQDDESQTAEQLARTPEIRTILKQAREQKEKNEMRIFENQIKKDWQG